MGVPGRRQSSVILLSLPRQLVELEKRSSPREDRQSGIRYLDRLDGFVTLLGESAARAGVAQIRHTVEFCHESSWNDAVAAVLKRHRPAFVRVGSTRRQGAVRSCRGATVRDWMPWNYQATLDAPDEAAPERSRRRRHSSRSPRRCGQAWGAMGQCCPATPPHMAGRPCGGRCQTLVRRGKHKPIKKFDASDSGDQDKPDW